MKLLFNIFKIIIVWFIFIVILILINNKYSKNSSTHKVVVSTKNSIEDIFASFSVEDITPDSFFYEKWIDIDGNGIFNPSIDKYIDKNSNGKFDAIYLAGLNKGRALQFIKDRLQLTVLLIIADQTLCIINYDGFGLSYQDIDKIKKRIAELFNIRNIVFLPNSNYNMPDLIGYWGILNKNGVSKDYLRFFEFKLYNGIKKALENPLQFKMYVKKDKVSDMLAYKIQFDNDSLFCLFIPKQLQKIYNNSISSDYYNKVRLYLGNVVFFNYKEYGKKLDRRYFYDFVVDINDNMEKVDSLYINFIEKEFYFSIRDFKYLLPFYSREVKRDVYSFTDLKSDLGFLCFNNNRIFLLNTEFSFLIKKKFIDLLDNKDRVYFIESSTDYINRKNDVMFEKILLKNLWDIEEEFEVDLIDEQEN